MRKSELFQNVFLSGIGPKERTLKEAIQIRLHPNNINRDSGSKSLTLGITIYGNTENEPITEQVG